jgi:hypothetical protein
LSLIEQNYFFDRWHLGFHVRIPEMVNVLNELLDAARSDELVCDFYSLPLGLLPLITRKGSPQDRYERTVAGKKYLVFILRNSSAKIGDV